MSNLDDDNPISSLMEVLIETAREAGPAIVDDLRELISTPYPPASAPGEPPHRRTSNLYGSITSDNEIREGAVAIIVFTDVYYAEFLEHGTDRMEPRPVWGLIESRWSSRLLDMLASNVQSSLG